MAPTDADIIDIRALRCEPLSEDTPAISNGTNEGEDQLFKQLAYIQSCVRKDKGLLGKWETGNAVRVTMMMCLTF